MNPEFLPTKHNLLATKKNLLLAKQGHDLLDKKQKVLMRELNKIKKSVNQLQMKLEFALEKAIKMLCVAKAGMGGHAIKKLCNKITPDKDLLISNKIIMGVLIPKVSAKNHTPPPYALWESTASIDEAFLAWQKVKFLMQKLAEVETGTRNLSTQLKKTQKRAAALKNIIIPIQEKRIKYISEQLEERERDDLARVRVARGRFD